MVNFWKKVKFYKGGKFEFRSLVTLLLLHKSFKSFLAAITTIEGVLKRTIMGLAQDQPVRRLMDPEGAKQIDDYVAKIESLLTLKDPFHVVRIFLK